jgi:hypothetical protein
LFGAAGREDVTGMLGGPVDVVEPFVIRETAGVLSDTRYRWACGVCPRCAMRTLPVIIAASSRSLFVMWPRGFSVVTNCC